MDVAATAAVSRGSLVEQGGWNGSGEMGGQEKLRGQSEQQKHCDRLRRLCKQKCQEEFHTSRARRCVSAAAAQKRWRSASVSATWASYPVRVRSGEASSEDRSSLRPACGDDGGELATSIAAASAQQRETQGPTAGSGPRERSTRTEETECEREEETGREGTKSARDR